MNRQPLNRILFLASMCIASTAFGGSEIVKCLDAAGNVTLTDQSCESGNAIVPMEVVADEPAEPAVPADVPAPALAAKAASSARFAVAARQAVRGARGPVARSSLSLDVAMLKVARLNLEVSDHAAAAARQQRLAGLN